MKKVSLWSRFVEPLDPLGRRRAASKTIMIKSLYSARIAQTVKTKLPKQTDIKECACANRRY